MGRACGCLRWRRSAKDEELRLPLLVRSGEGLPARARRIRVRPWGPLFVGMNAAPTLPPEPDTLPPAGTSSPRIACVGNMNNNNFALVRYLRDLGADAHLFLFENEAEHFLPACDTWLMDRWAPYVHRLRLGNNPRHLFWRWRRLGPPLRGFDFVIGSGLAPAFCSRAGLRLGLFYPYSPGIEFYQAVWMDRELGTAGPLKRAFYSYVRWHQARGIRRARLRTNLDAGGETDLAFRRLNCAYEPLGIPMVYPELAPTRLLPGWIQDLERRLAGCRLTVLSHSRQHWVRPPEVSPERWRLATKHNDYLVRGFAAYVRQRPEGRPHLLLFDYGKDVAATRSLIGELGLADSVLWLPCCPRREILELLRRVNVCVAEFMEEGIWGGTAWEGLATGRPTLQSVNFSAAEYADLAGHPLPPLLAVRSAEDVQRHLLRLNDSPQEAGAIGTASESWFQRHQGRALAARYLELIRRELSDGAS